MAWNTYEEIVASKDLSDYSKDILIRTRFPERYNEWKGYSAISTAPTQTIEQLVASMRGGIPSGGVPPPSGGAPPSGRTALPPTTSAGVGRKWEYEPAYGTWVSVEDPFYRRTQQPIPGAGLDEPPFMPGQIITKADGSQWYYTYDAQGNPIPHLLQEAPTKAQPPAQKELPSGLPMEYTDSDGSMYRYNPWSGRHEKIGYDPSKDVEAQRRKEPAQTPAISEYQKRSLEAEYQRIEAERQRTAAEGAWRQQQIALEKEGRLAELRAKPASWLEYASLAGQPAAVQPWMTGLLPQGSKLAVGQQIPGSQGGATMSGMPELTRPSQQYLSRIGPAPTQQYYGYERAQKGIPLEQTAWWLGEMAAPGGRFGGLSRRR